mgnify:CR=1 FL=1
MVPGVGRRKLIMPIYKALVATPDGLAFAVLLMNLCVTRLDRLGAPR